MRDYSLDFVKGVLVEIMILYHSINYFVGRNIILNYIDFVTGSFVFLSGYMVSRIYWTKYNANTFLIFKRLSTRGFKLIVIFIVVNAIINVMITNNYNNAQLGMRVFLYNFTSIFLFGDRRLAAFEILLPIAYSLIICATLLFIMRKRSLIITAIAVLFIFCSIRNNLSYNLTFLTIGLSGMVIGFIKKDDKELFFNKKFKFLSLFVVVMYYVLISIGISNIDIYFMGVVSAVLTIYLFGVELNYEHYFSKTLVMMGQYSLISYLSQILFLQILFFLLRYRPVLDFKVAYVFLVTNIFVFLFCKLTIYFRKRHIYIDKCYRIIFS